MAVKYFGFLKILPHAVIRDQLYLTRLSKLLSIPLIATEAAWPARTTRQAARFLFTDVTVTGWKCPSIEGPRRS